MMQPVFLMLNIHVRVLVTLSKCDFSTDYNGNYNKDAKPLWCDFIPSLTASKVQPNWKFLRFTKIKWKISLRQFY